MLAEEISKDLPLQFQETVQTFPYIFTAVDDSTDPYDASQLHMFLQ